MIDSGKILHEFFINCCENFDELDKKFIAKQTVELFHNFLDDCKIFIF